jgi:hypothetical protein
MVTSIEDMKKWLINNGIEPTEERIKNLDKLIAKAENEAYNFGINYRK